MPSRCCSPRRARRGRAGRSPTERGGSGGSAVPSCTFVVAPDGLCDPEGIWQRAERWLERVRQAGFPVAVVAQDGAEDYGPMWDEEERFDALFSRPAGSCQQGLLLEVAARRVDTGSSHSDLVFEARKTFREPGGWQHYRVPGWQQGAWSLTPYPDMALASSGLVHLQHYGASQAT